MPKRQSDPWKTRIANLGMVIFGLFMAITPLALWVAPTKPWFYFILEMFVISSVMVWFFSGFETSAAEHQQRELGNRSAFDKFASLLKSLNPFRAKSQPLDPDLQKLAERHRKELRDRSGDNDHPPKP